MGDTPSIKLPAEPKLLQALMQAGSPAELDPLTRQAGAEPPLLNIHMAKPLDMTKLQLGSGVFIPVMIATRDGGRQSLFNVPAGQRTLMGVFANETGMALKWMTRRTGSGPVGVGDEFQEDWTTRAGDPLVRLSGSVTAIDHGKGQGKMQMTCSVGGRSVKCDSIMILWTQHCNPEYMENT